MLYLPYLPSDLHQIFTVLFEILYAYYWLKFNLDRTSPLTGDTDQLLQDFILDEDICHVYILVFLTQIWSLVQMFFMYLLP